MAELYCPVCEKDFEIEWEFGDNVTCPVCKTEFTTDWDTDYEDNIYGPWIVAPV